jgi:alanine racemase
MVNSYKHTDADIETGIGMAHPYTTHIHINLDAIAANVRALADHVRGAELFAVVKANGYGHGAVPVARTALQHGATRLAVARPDEAVQLRRASITAPILMMGYALPNEIADVIELDVTPTITTIDAARAVSERAGALGKAATIHIKIDTGMGRSGLLPEEVVPYCAQVSALPHLTIEGVYTHFASADEADLSFTHQQFKVFTEALSALQQAGHVVPLRHAANSAATISLPEMKLDAVRCGVAIYGLKPSANVPDAVALRPALSLMTRVARIRTLPAGSSVGYGRTFIAEKPTAVALLPIGYGDGVFRVLSNNGCVLMHGQRAPIIGRVSMDQISVDVSGIAGVEQDDEAVLIGAQGDERITAEEVAVWAGTINYEVTTSLLPRVPRIYMRGGEVVDVIRPLAD